MTMNKHRTGAHFSVFCTAVLAACLFTGCFSYAAAPESGAASAGSGVDQTASSKASAEKMPSSVPAVSSRTEDTLQPVDESKETGLFASGYAGAEKLLSQMSLREKVGQIFVFQCPKNDALSWVREYQPGGYCLMGVSFKDKTEEQVKADLLSYQEASKIPMLLCTDEEGDTVNRVSRNTQLAKQPFQSPQQVYQAGGMEAIREDTLAKARMLKNLGVNMNLAPVADVSTNPADFIYARSFGQGAQATAEFVEISVKAYQEVGIGSALKHFPGYGSNTDTHNASAYDSRSYDIFQKSDFVPFRAGIAAGAPCVLVSHNVVACMDPDRPASLSPRVHEILREELGFTGLIITDDLAMNAASAPQEDNPAVEAFLAGNDLLLTGYIQRDFDAVFSAVLSGKITEQRLDESVLRILAWKNIAGLTAQES